MLIAVAAIAYELFQPVAGSGHVVVVVNVPNGASASQIGTLLADKGVIDSSVCFGLRARISGKRSELRSGRIVLSKDISYASALDALTTAFFFSSRRRHTRCGRDWSSDVCSSDLIFSSFFLLRNINQVLPVF